MYPLTIQINPSGWSQFQRRRRSKTFPSTRNKIFQRDDYRCQFCSFQAKKFQQIINLDGNYRNNKPSNLVTACVLCAHGHFIGSANFGNIIYLPEYSQAELNQVVRVLFCAMRDDCLYQETARTLYRSFRNRTQEVEKLFGDNASDSMIFGQSLTDITLPNKEQTDKVFSSLCLLPFRTPLVKPIEYWNTLIEDYWVIRG